MSTFPLSTCLLLLATPDSGLQWQGWTLAAVIYAPGEGVYLIFVRL